VSLPERIPLIDWAWDDLLFLVLAGVLIGAALLVVLGRDIIRSGLWMILSFAALAGVYVLLGAPLVAAAQVLVYIGAISVLVLFAIMLTQSKVGPSRLVFHHQAGIAGIAVLVLAAVLVFALTGTAWPEAIAQRQASGTDVLARLLFDQYVLPFEIVSVLLLAAVIGGVFLAKREDEAPEPAAPPLPGAAATEPPLGTVPPALEAGEGRRA
jgi:NADH-quinone oxidoreductase subunit J